MDFLCTRINKRCCVNSKAGASVVNSQAGASKRTNYGSGNSKPGATKRTNYGSCNSKAGASVVNSQAGASKYRKYGSLKLPEGLRPIEKCNQLYKFLNAIEYKDDEGVANEPGYEATDLMRLASISKETGDDAFQQGDFRGAIESYTKFIDAGIRFSPTVYARRSMCYVMCSMCGEAVSDAQQAVILSGGRPMAQIASDLESTALELVEE